MNDELVFLAIRIAISLFALVCLLLALWFEHKHRLNDRPKRNLRVYIAGGSSERLDIVRPLIARAKDLGVDIALDWTRDPNWDLGRIPTNDEFRESARRDLDAVRRADIVWLVVPRQKSEGAAFELGYALALGKRIVVSGDMGPRNIFAMLAHELDTFVDHEEALEHVARISRHRETEDPIDSIMTS